MKPIRLVLVLVLVLVLAAVACGGGATPPVAPPTQPVERVLVHVDAEGIALDSHDPIAYVTDGAPARGTAEHASQHDGATYRFASAEHKATFDGDMARHAPRYGGYCAYAASQNRLSPTDPQVWQIVDGQLLLFTNAQLRELFNADPAGHVRQADQHWPGLVGKHGTPRAP